MTRDQFIYGLTACGCLLKDGKTWYEHNELIKCFEDLGLFEQEPRKITLEDVKGYCEPRCLTIVSNELYYELTHPKIKSLEQEPFINKPCVSSEVCEYDKQNVLDKIRAEIEEYKSRQLTLSIGVDDLENGKQIALEYVLAILDKYKTGK